MKRVLTLLAVFVIALAVTACGSKNEDKAKDEEKKQPDFTITNMTAMEVHGLYISVANMEKWESLLGKKKVFHRGDSLPIYYDKLSDNESYDIKCEDEDGNKLVYEGLALSKIKKLTLTADESGKTYSITDEGGDIAPETQSVTAEETSAEATDKEADVQSGEEAQKPE